MKLRIEEARELLDTGQEYEALEALNVLIDPMVEEPEVHWRQFSADTGEVEWLVDGLITRGSLSMIASVPKAGKSTMARNLLVKAAQGGSWLGRTVEKVPALLVSCHEDSPEMLKDHFERMDLGETDPLYLAVNKDWTQGPVPRLENIVSRRGIGLVVIDTMAAFIPAKDLNDYALVKSALAPLKEMASRTNTTVLLLHHHNKSTRASEGSGVLGSQVIHGELVHLLEIRREGSVRTLTTNQRVGDVLERTRLDWDGTWVSLGLPERKLAQEDYSRRVLRFIGENGEASIQGIRRKVKGSPRPIGRAVYGLLEKGKLAVRMGGKKGTKKYYSLSPGEVSNNAIRIGKRSHTA